VQVGSSIRSSNDAGDFSKQRSQPDAATVALKVEEIAPWQQSLRHAIAAGECVSLRLQSARLLLLSVLDLPVEPKAIVYCR
jgi:hypothetical protein